MLVSVPFVKHVRPLADHIRPHIHPPAAAPSRPFLGGFQKLRARSCAALAFRNDQTIYFGSDIALLQMRHADMHPTNHAGGCVGGLRDKYSMLCNRSELPQSRGDLSRRSRIAELTRELRD